MYIADLPGTYQRAADIGAVFVNSRFKRYVVHSTVRCVLFSSPLINHPPHHITISPHSQEDAVDQCMFRTLEVIDPSNVAGGPLVRLEHEIRSVVNRDGSKYKSCPFDAIPTTLL